MFYELKNRIFFCALFGAVPITGSAQEMSLERYGFGEEGRIICVVPDGAADCNPLPSAITGDNIPRYAAELEALLPQIADGGGDRNEAVELLRFEGLDIAVLDAAIANTEHAWHNMRMEDIFQAPIGGTHVLYLRFNSSTGRLESGQAVPVPGMEPRVVVADLYQLNGNPGQLNQRGFNFQVRGGQINAFANAEEAANGQFFNWNPPMEAPENAADLIAQIEPGGNFRTQLTFLLATAGLSLIHI